MNERALSPPESALDYGDLPAFVASAGAWVETALPAHLPREEPEGYLYALVRDYPARGGKRFRPALLLLCAALAEGDPRRALPTAVALELFHNFALVHDDIEDASLLRRGRPTLHRAHGVPLALNAGDTLFALVYETLAGNDGLLGAEPAAAVRAEFQAMVRRTLEGQAWDIGWVAEGHWPTRAEYETMIRHKTGWYSGRGPCRMGALIGGAPAALVDRLGDFGESLGIGFQVRDDLLNLAPDSSARVPGGGAAADEGYGKERGGDIAEGKRTLIVIELMERLPPAEGERLREILSRPPAETDAAAIDWAIVRAEATGALAAVADHCREMGRRAHAALAELPESPQRSLLQAMVDYLVLERLG